MTSKAFPAPPHIRIRGLTKRFGATTALDSVDLQVESGAVHALIGENGAGKSTLAKILAGVHQPDAGTLEVLGRVVSFHSPRAALDHGITMIAQELALVPARNAVDNVLLGVEERSGPFVNRVRQRERLADLMDRTGIAVPTDVPARAMSIADQQKVEILRALARDARLVIMDEPTARLAGRETAQLKEIIRRLATSGTTVLYISHFLEEVLEVSDTVTIMRDGHVVRTSPTSEETPDSLVNAMIGRALGSYFPNRVPAPEGPPVLSVAGLSRPPAFADVDLTVRAGEIVGLAGLVGSGRTELVRAVYGADRATSGTVSVCGEPVSIRSSRQAIDAGIGLIAESRKDHGILPTRSVISNVSLPHLSTMSKLGFVRRARERAESVAAIDRAGVRCATPTMPIASLSGGNQQKAMFARWMVERPRLLIADEPTRGVDIGAKRAIYDQLVNMAGDGVGILVVSSELDELLGLCHRIHVMRQGRLVAELDAAEATEESIMSAAFGTESRGSMESAS